MVEEYKTKEQRSCDSSLQLDQSYLISSKSDCGKQQRHYENSRSLMFLTTENIMFENRNRRRIYIAYFRRVPSDESQLPYRTALLVAPKNPTAEELEDRKCFLMRYTNIINPTDGSFNRRYESRSTEGATKWLVGLLLLGKLPNSVSNEEISNLLSEKVTGPSWQSEKRCHHWVWASMLVNSSLCRIVHLSHNEIC